MTRSEFSPGIRPSRGPCAAPACDRGAIINSERGLVCNLHYQRLSTKNSFDLQEKTRLRDVECFVCKKPFDRGYHINGRRAKRPQFCSGECHALYTRSIAEARLSQRFWANVEKHGQDECWPWTGRAGHCGYGMFHVHGPCGEQLRIIASGADADDTMSAGWEHVSVSIERRVPNWREMCFVKNLFWNPEDCVVQFHPPESEYVNNHPNCLHLWRSKTQKFPLPPSILVGLKGVGEISQQEAIAVQIAMNPSQRPRT